MDSFNIYMLSEILLPLDIDSLIKMLQINTYYHHFIQTSNHVTEWFWNEYFEYHEYLPEETNLKRALQLRHLHRWYSKEFNYDDNYREFIKFEILSLYDCCINVIPKSLSLLKNVKILNLCKNRIRKIPESFSHLTNLQELYLNQNKITDIPESLSCLTNLEVLNLYDNQICEIPESLRHLPIHI